MAHTRPSKETKSVLLKDGDDLAVFVQIEPSAFDPAQEIPAVALIYRVVANSYGPTLQLVPLSDKVERISRVPKYLLDKTPGL